MGIVFGDKPKHMRLYIFSTYEPCNILVLTLIKGVNIIVINSTAFIQSTADACLVLDPASFDWTIKYNATTRNGKAGINPNDNT